MAAYSHTLRRLTKALQQRADALPVTSIQYGTVSSVVDGGASDGKALVTVNVGGTLQQMGYIEPFTATVGQTVCVMTAGKYPLILGHPAGLPSF